ncbi:uncharacterized protein STEHIDRAFT_147323 [Stereum hirsutum FP-91666 SS1]|uniref:uncharacterized protein n=1 Tax=Stereum hirsutum (strain FP-91666) TaxID=721885 RepID=UPI000444A36B|nr:uncharacterized protein STEHIDRAFT_147323 [Stereum hirsutum FP-91666 SS1]EIM86871.1 hypothetical protein STEHIDRAFT_147323 [Stereum hirsutum FP-91666 SS1]
MDTIEDEKYIFTQSSSPVHGKVSRTPTTPGQLILRPSSGQHVNDLSLHDFLEFFIATRHIALHLQSSTSVHRVAMACDGIEVQLIPLHGIGEEWQPILHGEKVWYDPWPGWFTTKNGPTATPESLVATQTQITAVSDLQQPYDLSFYDNETGADVSKPSTEDISLFARLVRGELEQWRVWESPSHVAWLTPFANTRGFTVLVPRRHLSSDVFGGLAEDEYKGLLEVTWEVMGVLRKAFAGGAEERVRVAIFFEGFEIDYTHVKLLPAIVRDGEVPGSGYGGKEFNAEYYEVYPGFITTQRGPPASNQEEVVSFAGKMRQALRVEV